MDFDANSTVSSESGATGQRLIDYELVNAHKREIRRQRGKSWRFRNSANEPYILRRLAHNALRRAKKLGVSFDWNAVVCMTLPKRCPYLGIPMRCHEGEGYSAQQADSYTLDRVDKTQGYVQGNMEIISAKANTIKGRATATEVMRVAVAMMQRGLP